MFPDKIYPLTNAQERIWFTQIVYPNSSMFNIGGTVRIHGQVDVNTLRLAFAQFVFEHDSLRLQYTTVNEKPFQYISSVTSADQLDIPFVDFENYQDKEKELDQWVRTQTSQLLLLRDMPLYRFIIFRTDFDQYGYLFLIHHIVADGWSFQIFTQELQENYEMLIQNKPKLKRLQQNFDDYLICEEKYLNSPKYEKDKSYWNRVFSTPVVQLATSCTDCKGYRSTFFISEKYTQRIKHFCRTYSISESAFYSGVCVLYTYKTQGLTDIVIGNPVLGRSGRKERDIFGMFVNTLPLRYQIESKQQIKAFFQNIDSKVKKNLIHQKYPYNHIIRDLKLGSQSLYSMCVNYYNTKMAGCFAGFPVTNSEFFNGEQEYNIQLIVRDWLDDSCTQIDIDSKETYLSKDQVSDMFEKLMNIIEICVSDPEQTIGGFSLLSDIDWMNQILQFNNTYSKLPEGTILNAFLSQTSLTPNRLAVQDGEEYITYADLAEKVYIVAARLQTKGICKGKIVGLLTKGSAKAVISILGILASGGAYLPIDPQWPSDRITLVLKDAGINILLSDGGLSEEVNFNGETISLDQLLYSTDAITSLQSFPKSNDLAYVIYTSGSTGKPKGVMIKHRSLLNYILWAKDQYIKLDHEIMPLYSSLAFDLTVTTIFLPLICGGTIKVYHESTVGTVLDSILDEDICTLIKLTPAHLRTLMERNEINSRLHTLIIGGEKFSTTLATKISSIFSNPIIIYNEYGPTEATVGCMLYKFDGSNKTESVPIGSPAYNTKILVVDKDKNPVPIWAQGELYIGGECLSLGYLNCSDLTSERFVSTLCGLDGPFYRTGDIVRFISSNCIEFIGRVDRQINNKGYRIEPIEIENCLCNQKHIKEAVVVSVNWNETEILCAYYVADMQLDEEELKRTISAQLPYYMVPSVFYAVNSIPLTINKKIDYAHLPHPEMLISKLEQSEVINQRLGQKEKVLLDCLSSIFDHQVSINQNFYYIGGDSIKAIQLSSHMFELGYQLSVKDILNNPTIHFMAKFIHNATVPVHDQSNCKGLVPLTPAVEWFIHVFGKNHETQKTSNSYCHCLHLALSTSWTKSELQEVMKTLISHHDSLRLIFDKENGCLKYNDSLDVSNLVHEYNLGEGIKEIGNIINEQLQFLINSINIYEGPIICAELLHADNHEDTMLLVIHHLAVDGVSWRIILEDLETLLSQMTNGQPRILPLKTASFQLWARRAQQESYRYKKEISYWESQQKKYIKFPNVNEFLTKPHMIQSILDIQTTQDLMTKACAPYRTDVEELLLVALAIALGPIFSIDEVIIERESQGRVIWNDSTDDTTRTVGWFSSFYPVKLPTQTQNKDWDNRIKTVKEILHGISDLGIGYGLCAEIQDRWQKESQWIRFNYLGAFQTQYKHFSIIPDVNIEFIVPQTNFLDILVLMYQDKLYMQIRYNPNCLAKSIVQHIADDWKKEIIDIVQFCLNKDVPELTPSDFENLALTQEEIDGLFE